MAQRLAQMNSNQATSETPASTQHSTAVSMTSNPQSESHALKSESEIAALKALKALRAQLARSRSTAVSSSTMHVRTGKVQKRQQRYRAYTCGILSEGNDTGTDESQLLGQRRRPVKLLTSALSQGESQVIETKVTGVESGFERNTKEEEQETAEAIKEEAKDS